MGSQSIIGFGSGSGDRSASETGFVGENTPGDTFLHGYDHGAQRTAGSGAETEGSLYDFHDGAWNPFIIKNEDQQGGCHVSNSHKWNYDL